jgi:OmpA-OmpF porin, OOP family
MNGTSKKALTALAASMALCMVTAARADTTPGWYIGAAAGTSNYGALIDNATQGISGSINTTNTATGWSALGGFQFNDWFGLEASYFDMGNASTSATGFGTVHATVKLTGESFDAVLDSSPQGFGVFGKFGITAAKVDEPINSSFGPPADATANNNIYDIGVGVSYATAGNWMWRLGYTQYHDAGDSNSTGKGNVNFLYLGAIYRF